MSYPSQSSPIDNDFHPTDSDMSATDDHWGTKLAGDVVPIRPVGSPSNNAGREGQRRNQGAQSPNIFSPNTNIVPIR